MDMQMSTSDESEAALHEDRDDIDDTALENERCGICMDVIIDRGVLDCCQHWFCFVCIDNWATITNLCPLCKNEFQLITCLPVYDTIGSVSSEEHPLSRDDDWCIQGRNNTLSFPSYYIDEDAVTCLDGDACKIRSGMSTNEDYLTIDTSIACDSCDIWYHAFCVGFNPECTSENSWLCPRCITNEVAEKPDDVSYKNLGKHSEFRCADLGWSIDPSFSEKVSVSVADAGETAVVVSMVEGKHMTEANKSLPSVCMLDVKTDMEPETSLLDFCTGSAKHDVQVNKSEFAKHTHDSLICSYDTGSNVNPPSIQDCSAKVLDVSPNAAVSQDDLQKRSLIFPSSEIAPSEITVMTLDSNQVTHEDLKANNILEGMYDEDSNVDEYMVFSPLSCDVLEPKTELSDNITIINLSNALPMASSSVEDLVRYATKDHMVGCSSAHPSEESAVSVNEIVSSISDNTVAVGHQKNLEVNYLMSEQMEKSLKSPILDNDCGNSQTGKRERELQAKVGTSCTAKKARLEEKSRILPLSSQVHNSASDYTGRTSKSAAFLEGDNLRSFAKKEDMTADIMSIVQENDHDTKSSKDSVGKRENAAGLRVKKIMRRVGENKESSILVQKLRREIREAVQHEASDVTSKNDFSGELLMAFQAALLKPESEVDNGFGPCLRNRKSLLQKGKTRENLTKKIYATSSGRRRHAWDRDWEIEFWKHRCMRTTPEKVETLQSVLGLLNKVSDSCPENSEIEHKAEGDLKNSILSRLYLADASVFPRKDDIQPLSALRGNLVNGNLDEKKMSNLKKLCEKDSKQVPVNHVAKSSFGILKGSSQGKGPVDNIGKRFSAPSIKVEASHMKGNSDMLLNRAHLCSVSGNSKENSENPKDSTKMDKQKWALEVLARKNALMTTNATKETQEDNNLLKGNYPLLAQLPADMRPVPAPSRHNKVSMSVRQALLYRITEHYLRKTNLSTTRRTADTELAVADAVNIEKEIFERSNSKLVYMNLGSQALSQQKNKPQADKEFVSDSVAAITCSDQEAEEKFSYSTVTSSSKVEEALRMTGLSDSPPNSPNRPMKNPDDEDADTVDARDKGIEHHFAMDSQTNLDILGDFEHHFEGGIHTSFIVVNASDDRDSRSKILLPTLNSEKSESLCDVPEPRSSENESAANYHDNLKTLEVPSSASPLYGHQKENSKGSTALHVSMNDAAVQEPSQAKLSKEPSLAECKDFCGPDREPSINRVCDGVVPDTSNFVEKDAAIKTIDISETGKFRSKEGGGVSVLETESWDENCNSSRLPFNHESSGGENSPACSSKKDNVPEEGRANLNSNKSELVKSLSRKVEAYVKEHLRPLCKSGVITVEQYRWAVSKTTEKVMRYHYKAPNATFLIKEGAKVKKLAEDYAEASQQREWQ